MTAPSTDSPRVLAVDLGEARVGLAVSDAGRLLARPLAIVKAGRNLEGRVAAQAREQGAGVVVVGLPLNADGSRGVQAEKAERFAVRLRAAARNVEVVLFDERWSTEEAQDRLASAGATRRRRAEHPDAVAAAVILQGYLDELRRPARAAANPEPLPTSPQDERP